MELFNYISAAVSIVLAISIAHLLSGLRDVVAPGRRDWLVVCWYGYLAYFHLLTWWSLFAVHESSAWNLGKFALAMVVPSLLYLALHILISEAPTAVPSWREHFEKVRPWFFTFFALFIATSAVRETVLLGRPILGMASGFDTISVLNATVGAVSSHGRIQVVVFAIELSLAFLASAERFYGRTLPFRCDFNFFHPSFDFDRVVRPPLLPSDVSVADLLLQARRNDTSHGYRALCMVSGPGTRRWPSNASLAAPYDVIQSHHSETGSGFICDARGRSWLIDKGERLLLRLTRRIAGVVFQASRPHLTGESLTLQSFKVLPDAFRVGTHIAAADARL